jgi:hypothetical protein
LNTQVEVGRTGINELLNCTIDLYSFILIDGSCPISISVEGATYDIGQSIVLPKMLSRDEVIRVACMPSHDLMVDYDVRLPLTCGE